MKIFVSTIETERQFESNLSIFFLVRCIVTQHTNEKRRWHIINDILCEKNTETNLISSVERFFFKKKKNSEKKWQSIERTCEHEHMRTNLAFD